MPTPMGLFRVALELGNPARPSERRVIPHALVDTGAHLSWVPAEVLEALGIARSKTWRFRQADGGVLSRATGEARLFVAGTWTIDEVVFGEPGDLVLLGAHSLEGLNLLVDPIRMQLIDAGPAPAAAA